MDAAERFAAGRDSALIAKELRIHVRSVQRWRTAWSAGGEAGLVSKAPVSRPILSEELFAVLELELDKSPAAHGWEDQTWILARIATLIGRRFHKSYTPQGLAALLRRRGWSHQVPATRDGTRRSSGGRMGEGDLAAGGRTRAALEGWLVFEDEAGFSMSQPTSRTWSRRGLAPVIRVRGRSRRRLSVAARTCYKPGERPRLIYRPTRDRTHGRKSFDWRDHRDLLITAHARLAGPIIVV